MLGARPQQYVDIARPRNNAGARVFEMTCPRHDGFWPQPEGTGRVLAHGVTIGRLVDIKYTAASAVSPCAKIAAVAHAGIDQRVPK
jgi:hypothetical protein